MGGNIELLALVGRNDKLLMGDGANKQCDAEGYPRGFLRLVLLFVLALVLVSGVYVFAEAKVALAKEHSGKGNEPSHEQGRPGNGGTPPGDGGTPPGHGGTPPGHEDPPPGDGATPPGHGGTPPDDG